MFQIKMSFAIFVVVMLFKKYGCNKARMKIIWRCLLRFGCSKSLYEDQEDIESYAKRFENLICDDEIIDQLARYIDVSDA